MNRLSREPQVVRVARKHAVPPIPSGWAYVPRVEQLLNRSGYSSLPVLPKPQEIVYCTHVSEAY